MSTQDERALRFRALHEREGAFIIPNPWDAGSARVLAALGFEALATTSAGYAWTTGQRDNTNTRDDVLAHVRTIVDATDLPVSADLADGLADTPDAVTETYRLAAATGLVGASIEDAGGDGQLYPIDMAVERVRAAVAGVRALPFPFTLTARTENYLVGNPDLADTIARLQAYQEAGADVLYAPGIKTTADIAAIVAAIDRPLNVIAGAPGLGWSVDELAALGVKRISTGAALARAALTGFLAAAREMHDDGTFAFADSIVSGREINAMFSP